MGIPDDSPSDKHRPRDSLSRALRLAKTAVALLESERWQQVGGPHSGLRSYGMALARLITEMVTQSEATAPDEFDTIVAAVDVQSAELNVVLFELLEF
jgi:hypothetical protein